MVPFFPLLFLRLNCVYVWLRGPSAFARCVFYRDQTIFYFSIYWSLTVFIFTLSLFALSSKFSASLSTLLPCIVFQSDVSIVDLLCRRKTNVHLFLAPQHSPYFLLCTIHIAFHIFCKHFPIFLLDDLYVPINRDPVRTYNEYSSTVWLRLYLRNAFLFFLGR